MTDTRNTRRCFESELANAILTNAAYFEEAIKKVSTSIVALLNHSINVVFFKKNNIINDEILQQLYSNTNFGVLGKAMDSCYSQEVFMDNVVDACKNSSGNLPKIIHIHQVFMQYVFDKLPFKFEDSERLSLKDKLVKAIFVNNPLFKNARVKIDPNAGDLTTRVGIAGDAACRKVEHTEIHKNILGMFSKNSDSYWGKLIEKEKLPFVAGPSGHTGSSILLAICIADLNLEELKQYLAAVQGVLIAGGYHSADEVMAIANLTGISYQPGKYHHLLPKQFLQSPAVSALTEHYQEFFNKKDFLINDSQETTSPAYDLGIAAGHGVIQGTAKVVEALATTKQFSRQSAYIIHQLVYYFGFFSMKLSENYLLSGKQDLLENTATDTIQLFMLNALAEELLLFCYESLALKPSLTSTIGFGFCSYFTNERLSSTITSLATSYLTSIFSEKAGRWLFSLPKDEGSCIPKHAKKNTL